MALGANRQGLTEATLTELGRACAKGTGGRCHGLQSGRGVPGVEVMRAGAWWGMGQYLPGESQDVRESERRG